MKSEFALKPASVFSRGAATECSPGRQPGVGVVLEISPGGAEESEDSFAPPGLGLAATQSTGLRPWLHSYAAPRLAIALSPLRGWLSRRTLDTSTSGTRGGSTSLTTPSARSCLLFKEGNQ